MLEVLFVDRSTSEFEGQLDSSRFLMTLFTYVTAIECVCCTSRADSVLLQRYISVVYVKYRRSVKEIRDLWPKRCAICNNQQLGTMLLNLKPEQIRAI